MQFSRKQKVKEPDVTVDEDVVAQMSKFRYIELAIQINKEIDEYVMHQIQDGLLKQRATISILFDKRCLTRLKDIASTMMQSDKPCCMGLSVGQLKYIYEHMMEEAEMRMLR